LRELPQLTHAQSPAGQADGWFRDPTAPSTFSRRTSLLLARPASSLDAARNADPPCAALLGEPRVRRVRISLTRDCSRDGSFISAPDGRSVPGQTISSHPACRRPILLVPLRIASPASTSSDAPDGPRARSSSAPRRSASSLDEAGSPVWQERRSARRGRPRRPRPRLLGKRARQALRGHAASRRGAVTTRRTRRARPRRSRRRRSRRGPRTPLAGLHALLP